MLFIVLAIGRGFILPPIVQPDSYHAFADQRAWNGIPYFSDVLSNVIFTAVGAAGLYRVNDLSCTRQKARLFLAIFFAGLLLTGPGSAFYHWAPDARTILVDPLPMVIAFAGILGTFLTQCVSSRIGLFGLIASLAAGGAGLLASAITGNLALYLVLQFGGLTGIVLGLLTLENHDDNLPWWALIGWYVLAKALELGDHVVWNLTDHIVSGHTLKHLAAEISGVVFLRAISGLPWRPAQLTSA